MDKEAVLGDALRIELFTWDGDEATEYLSLAAKSLDVLRHCDGKARLAVAANLVGAYLHAVPSKSREYIVKATLAHIREIAWLEER